MPTVAWWNVAGAGGSASASGGEVMDWLEHGLFFLEHNSKPDVIILGEVLNDFDKQAQTVAPKGYTHVQIDETTVGYKSATSKKYAVFSNGTYTVKAKLITDPTSSGFSRPGLSIKLKNGSANYPRLVALHLASVTASTKPQRKQMVQSIVDCGNKPPIMLIGDFNVDAKNPAKLGKVKTEFANKNYAAWLPKFPNTSTHSKGNTLDWVMHDPGLTAVTVDALKPQGGGKKKKAKYDDDDDDFDPMEDNEELFDKSDHYPIVASW